LTAQAQDEPDRNAPRTLNRMRSRSPGDSQHRGRSEAEDGRACAAVMALGTCRSSR